MPTVLVVDDSTTDRRLATGLLQKNPAYTLLQATNGKAALELIESHLPDLVLTDLMMPEMNGLELVEAIRKEYPLIPVILMTAAGSEEIAVQALRKGASSYVPKKLLGEELLHIVERVISASHEEKTQARLWNRLVHQELAFAIENDLSLLMSLCAQLREAFSNLRMCDKTQVIRVGIALEEALLNAYYHGNLEVSSDLREKDHRLYYDLAEQRTKLDPYKQRKLHVHARLSRDQATFVITDEGAGFDRSTLPDPTDPANIERPCGRGLLLMQTFMDEVKFNEKGNEVTMIRRREPLDVQSELIED